MHPIPLYSVLLLSDFNTDRSLLAECLLRDRSRGRFVVQSAGLRPAGRVDPLVTQVLAERYHLHPENLRSKSWQEFQRLEFDFIITLSEEAKLNRVHWRGQPVRAHWGSPRPTELAATVSGLRQAFEDVAAQIAARATAFCALPEEALVRGAWDMGSRFVFRSDYSALDEEHLECAGQGSALRGA